MKNFPCVRQAVYIAEEPSCSQEYDGCVPQSVLRVCHSTVVPTRVINNDSPFVNLTRLYFTNKCMLAESREWPHLLVHPAPFDERDMGTL